MRVDALEYGSGPLVDTCGIDNGKSIPTKSRRDGCSLTRLQVFEIQIADQARRLNYRDNDAGLVRGRVKRCNVQ